MFQKLGAKIREKRKEKGLTQTVLAEMVGSSQSNINRIEKGQTPGVDLLSRIAKTLDVDMHELLGDDSNEYQVEMSARKDRQFQKELADMVREQAADFNISFRLPVVSVAHANPVAIAKHALPTKKYIEIRPGTICIEVTDDSMMPVAWPGQCVLCDPKTPVESGDMVVVKLKGQSQLFKRAYYNKGDREWLLNSVNPARAKPPIIVPEKMVEFMYRVIGTIYEPPD